MGEYDAFGSLIQETVWLEDIPIAVIKPNGIYYIYANHLNTPGLIENTEGTAVWRWGFDPFGVSMPDEDPDGDGVVFSYNLRFPGQYYDQETGLHYNWHRYYDPKIGRYLTPDPIGLAGGINPYVYVQNNPVNFVDSWGLLTADWHHFITLVAALNSGMGLRDSLRLSWNASAVDFTPGSQGFGAEATAQHAMAGVLPDGTRQSPQEAIIVAENFVQSNKSCGNLAEAVHAAQDLATPGHAGQPWMGFGWNWITVSHILGDLVPSPGTIAQAYRNTLRVLK